ncbi:hypothetical protein Tco_0949262 [Tanacetum coccineum]
MIGDVQSLFKQEGMKLLYSEQGCLNAIYEGKTFLDIHTCLFACFLSYEEPKRDSKALSDPTWIEEDVYVCHLRKKGTYLDCSIRYVDDIIFGSTNKELCDEYENLPLTPTRLEKPLVKMGDAADVDEHLYRSMIRIFDVPTSSRTDHQNSWYYKDYHLELVAYTDSDYAGATQDRKSTTRGSLDTKPTVGLWAITEASLRRHLKLEDHDGITSITNSEIFEQLALMGYQANSDKLTFQKEYHVPSPNESPLHAVHSHGSDEGSLKLIELMNLVTKLSERIGVLEDDLKRTKQTYSAAFTKLILRIKKLESKVKTGKARKRARVVLSEDEEDDSSKQGRKISDIDEDLNTYFAQDDEVVHDQDTAKEGQPEDSTAGITVSTAPINISTARETRSTAGRVVYGRRSKEARKDKGKAIMTEPEPEKKSKKLLEQERLGLEEAIRLQEQVDKEERAQIARDEEIARQLFSIRWKARVKSYHLNLGQLRILLEMIITSKSIGI